MVTQTMATEMVIMEVQPMLVQLIPPRIPLIQLQRVTAQTQRRLHLVTTVLIRPVLTIHLLPTRPAQLEIAQVPLPIKQTRQEMLPATKPILRIAATRIQLGMLTMSLRLTIIMRGLTPPPPIPLRILPITHPLTITAMEMEEATMDSTMVKVMGIPTQTPQQARILQLLIPTQQIHLAIPHPLMALMVLVMGMATMVMVMGKTRITMVGVMVTTILVRTIRTRPQAMALIQMAIMEMEAKMAMEKTKAPTMEGKTGQETKPITEIMEMVKVEIITTTTMETQTMEMVRTTTRKRSRSLQRSPT